uniref:Putative secreted protein n=1 Tax=Anopheles triannulatus TaxID=58253 RepID=A0A2M4B4B5_9DIPT
MHRHRSHRFRRLASTQQLALLHLSVSLSELPHRSHVFQTVLRRPLSRYLHLVASVAVAPRPRWTRLQHQQGNCVDDPRPPDLRCYPARSPYRY